MSTLELLTHIQNSSLAHVVSKSNHLVGAGLQILHVLGFILLLASLVLINLRLLDFAFQHQTVAQVSRESSRLIWWGLALAVISGVLMFIASPALYYYKPIFKAKILLLLLAVVFQFFLYRKIVASDTPSVTQARMAVLLSLTLWFGIGFAGRIIGFV